MKTKGLIISVFIGLLFLFNSCESNKDEFLSDFSTILYFVDSGEVPLTLYKTGEDGDYQLSIYKAGSKSKASASATVKVMGADELAAYNLEKGTKYTLLPQEYYQISSSLNLNFTSSAMNQSVDVTFKTNMIDQLPVIAGQYVLPLELSSSTDSVNTAKRRAFVVPKVLIPSVYFSKTGYQHAIITEGGIEVTTFQLAIAMPMKNQWSFDCEVSIEPAVLESYNQANGTNYEMLPSESYALNKTVAFLPGENAKTIEVSIDRKNLTYGDYILPMKLNSCSMDAFEIDQSRNVCLLRVTYMPPKIVLTADMLSTNAQEQSEGPISNLVDNDKNTMFHTSWSEEIYDKWGHYIDVKLNEPITKVILSYWTRQENGNGAPTNIVVYISEDGISYSKIGTISEGLPKTGNTEYISPLFQSPRSFKYLRVAVTESVAGEMNEYSAAYFNMSEFALFGSN